MVIVVVLGVYMVSRYLNKYNLINGSLPLSSVTKRVASYILTGNGNYAMFSIIFNDSYLQSDYPLPTGTTKVRSYVSVRNIAS